MKNIFVTHTAFEALSLKGHEDQERAIDFVQSLFSKTVLVFSSQLEIVTAASTIRKVDGFERMKKFLVDMQEGGIVLLPEDPKLALSSVRNLNEEGKGSIYHASIASIMKEFGIKDLFSFDPDFQHYGVIVWPK